MRNIGFTEFCRLVEAFGFKLRRVSGSHYIYRHPSSRSPATVEPATAPEGSEAVSNLTVPRHGRGTRSEDGTPPMTAKYHINLFWSEPDGAWVADVPDLQSCSAFGDSPAEALAEVEKAIEAWLAVAREDGLPLPEPRYRAPARAVGCPSQPGSRRRL